MTSFSPEDYILIGGDFNARTSAVARALPLWMCDLQICRVNVEFTRVSEAAENDGTKCRRQTAGVLGSAVQPLEDFGIWHF